MTSEDTIGSSLYSRIPLSAPSEAAFIAALMSSLVTFFDSTAVRSVIDPAGTGTRRLMPVSLPFTWGKTSPTAFAAPVEVGMMFRAAARER